MCRDDFSRQIIDTLGKRVGVRCSNPSCRKLTTGPREHSDKIVNIGVAAHITAASPRGPRYNANLSDQERSSIENGIWLCQNCAKLVDNDPGRYCVEVLRMWKSEAEHAALQEIEGNVRLPPVDLSAELSLSFKKAHITGERHDYELSVIVSNKGSEPLGQFHVDLEMPAKIIEYPERCGSYLRDRSRNGMTFFRFVFAGGENDIFPGDDVSVLIVPYYMDREIFDDKGHVMNRPVIATLYRRGFRPVIIEQPFSEFQIF